MKTMKTWLLGLCVGMALPASAHDFTVTVNGQKLYFNITNKAARTAEVTYRGSMKDHPVCTVQGDIRIPEQVKHNNVVYNITAIGAKAFSGAQELSGIVLPSTIARIGDFAFENCTSLCKVVFPGRAVAFGQGTFFRCTGLKDLSFGSDWKELDLTPYRWSDSLQTLAVPAKVEKIRNLKQLRSLRSVTVDANNTRFSAFEGVLYNKDGKTLYGAPRQYSGTLRVKDGTETLVPGALADCVHLERVVFPQSLSSFSFRETARMASLNEIVFKSALPPHTARLNGKEVFLLQTANPKVKLTVPKDAKKTYAQNLVTQPGEYCELSAKTDIPYQVNSNELPSAKQIDGIKHIDTYE